MNVGLSQNRKRRAWLEVMGELKCLYCPHNATEHTGDWGGYVHVVAVLLRPFNVQLIGLTCDECGSVCWRRAREHFEDG